MVDVYMRQRLDVNRKGYALWWCWCWCGNSNCIGAHVTVGVGAAAVAVANGHGPQIRSACVQYGCHLR